MGFVRRIGRAFRRVGRAVRRVGSFVGKAFKTVTKPLSKVVKGFTGFASKLLNKLPFGRAITGFLGKFLQNPLSLLSSPVLGGLGGLLGDAGIGALLQATLGAAKTPAWQNPQGRSNMMNMVAHQHAKNLSRHVC